MHFPLVLSHPAQYQYRNEVPQHHHRDLPSSRAVCHSSVLSNQHSWGCVKFGTKRPQVQILSPRPVPQVSDLRECRASVACVPLRPPSRRPEGTKKGTRGNPREGRGRLRQAEEHPASPHGTADPTAQQTPRHSRDPHGTLIPRPQRRNRLVGTPTRQEAVTIRSRQTRQACPIWAAAHPGQRVSANDPPTDTVGLAQMRPVIVPLTRPLRGSLEATAADGT